MNSTRYTLEKIFSLENIKKMEVIIDIYGEEHQLLKLSEELAELIQAIQKHLQKQDCMENILTEMADVFIVLGQILFSLTSRNKNILLDKVMFKLNRTIQILESKIRKLEDDL